MTARIRMQVADLLDRARERFAGTSTGIMLDEARTRLHEPLRIAIAGKVKAGKSTLLNALVGEELAPTDAGECTRVVTWYRNGLTYKVMLHPAAGSPVQVPFRREDGALVVRMDGHAAETVERLVVDWPSSSLRSFTLIDTPGIGSLSPDIAERTHAFLTPEDQPAEADAVCYLMRHLHGSDARFLESFHDDRAARATPMNAIGVLSRADEIGVSRLDAIQTAERIARRYRSDSQIRRLCQTVLPVAGLLGQAGVTLRQDEFAALTTLAGLDRAEAAELLLSVDRFADDDVDVGVDVARRRALLDRMGMFGVRLSLALIRGGAAPTASQLAAQLVRHSGVDALREALSSQFAARADLLKARSALVALNRALRPLPDRRMDDLTADVERIISGTHEFAEARALNALRAGYLPIDDAAATDAERLLGGHGDAPHERLAVASGDHAELRAAAAEALARWRRRAEHPLAPRAEVEAAGVIVRSCEGILAALNQRSSVTT